MTTKKGLNRKPERKPEARFTSPSKASEAEVPYLVTPESALRPD